MVSFNVYRSTSSGAYVEGVCLATDEKPITGIANGSILYAVDPTDGSTTRYMFDQSTASWIEAECPCSGSGSGGSSGGGEGGTLIVTGTFSSLLWRVVAIDKSYNELKAAYDAGKIVLVRTDCSLDSELTYVCSYLSTLTSYPADPDDPNSGIIYEAHFTDGCALSADDPDEPMTYDDDGGGGGGGGGGGDVS